MKIALGELCTTKKKQQKSGGAQNQGWLHKKCRKHFTWVTSSSSPGQLGGIPSEEFHPMRKRRGEPQQASLPWGTPTYAPVLIPSWWSCLESPRYHTPRPLLPRVRAVMVVRPVTRTQLLLWPILWDWEAIAPYCLWNQMSCHCSEPHPRS